MNSAKYPARFRHWQRPQTSASISQDQWTLSEKDQLLDQRRDLSILNELHDPFARQIPVELVSTIFCYCLSSSHMPRQDVMETPPSKSHSTEEESHGLEFMRVCVLWRNIALKTPELWTRIRVRMRLPTHISVTATKQGIELWIRRSGRVPLNIEITSGCGKLITRDDILQYIQLITKHTARWKYLSLEGVPPFFMKHISSILTRRPPVNLRHISLGDMGYSGVHETLASRLGLTQTMDQIIFSLANITHFTATHQNSVLSVSSCIQIFKEARRLVFCDLPAIHCSDKSLATTLVVSPSLLTLSIQHHPDDFWEYFTFPSLKALRVSKSIQPSSWLPLQVFFERSADVIWEISWYMHDFPVKPFFNLLRASPNLKKLNIEGALTAEFFMELQSATALKTAGSFLQNLESLTCTLLEPTSFVCILAFLKTILAREKRTLRVVKLILGVLVDLTECVDKETLEDFISVTDGINFTTVGRSRTEGDLDKFWDMDSDNYSSERSDSTLLERSS